LVISARFIAAGRRPKIERLPVSRASMATISDSAWDFIHDAVRFLDVGIRAFGHGFMHIVE
jgi:hypothetical protein